MVLKTFKIKLLDGIVGKWNYWKIKSNLLEIGIRNIERWSWKHWNWKHWKIELETLENGIGNVGK